MSASVISGQMYELRPMADTSTTMAVGMSSMADGAAIVRCSVLNINDQKWTLNNSESGWRIVNVNSSKLMVISWPSGVTPFVNGRYVVQYSSGTVNTYWNIVQLEGDSGTTTINETECPVVRIFAGGTGTALSLTYNANGFACIATANEQDTTQQFALLPTWATNAQIPAPYNLGASAAVGTYENGGNVKNTASGNISFTVYPFWTCAPARAEIAQFQYRFRKRSMSASSNWGNWQSWSAWTDAAVTRSGNQFWLTGGLSATIGSGKQIQAQFEVRDTTTSGDITYVGATAQGSVMFYQRPVVNITGATWSPDGLRLSVSTNYVKGSTNVNITSIQVSGRELLGEPVMGTLTTTTGTILINQTILKGIPSAGATATVTYQVGTDQYMLFPDVFTGTPTIAYEGGSTPVSLAFSQTDGMALTCDLSDYDARLWVLVGDELTEMKAENGVFKVYYPLGVPYTVFASGSDGSNWFASSVTRTENARKVHAINWYGGYLLIEHNTESLTVEDSIEAVHNVYDLNSRAYQTVTFAPIRHQALSPAGVLIEEFSTSNRDAVADAVGKHAIYRSPAGDLFPVAIVDATRKTTTYWCEVSVSLIRESE